MKKPLFAVILFILMVSRSYGQENWGGGVDDEVLHFGFTFQYINTEFKILKKGDWRKPFYDPDAGPIPINSSTGQYATDSLYSISSAGTPGFGLGFVSNLRLSNNADIRLTPNLVFADRVANYEYLSRGEVVEKKVQSTLVDLPLDLKIKSDRRKNFRAYMLGGVRYSMDIISKKKLDDDDKIATEKLLKNRKRFFSWETGIGFDLYFEYFKLSPEIKFSQSFNDVLLHENNPYSSPIDKLFLRNIQISLYFE